ncbi:hypothetical protein EMCRGX_G007081 [Ephydatia muelleri]
MLNGPLLYPRCGTGLQMLYNHPNVQLFLNGIPAKTLLAGKAIYQPGAARKASRAGEVKFSILRFVTVGVVSSTVEELSMMDTPFTVLYHDPQQFGRPHAGDYKLRIQSCIRAYHKACTHD